MMRRCTRLCLTILVTLSFCASALAETNEEVAAREVALELAGAFSNDGFKIRDGHWSGTLAKGESKIFAVNLYAGNEYWFSAGATETAKKLAVDVFDETGAPVVAEKFNSGTKAAAGFSVSKSGQYFVRVRLEEGEAAGVCFLYSYK
jgi:hypothetical protein